MNACLGTKIDAVDVRDLYPWWDIKKHQCGRVTSGFDTGMGLSLYNGQNIWSSFTVFFNCVLVLSGKELSLFVEACMVFSWM